MQQEWLIRLSAFVGVLVLLAVWEWYAPRRSLSLGRARRWASNMGLVLLNTVAVRLIFALGLVGLALWTEEQSWGLFHWLALPVWLSVPLAFLVLDLAIYLQHVAFHTVPWLWRLHAVHHVDLDIDVTTGIRFHTLEILLSLAIKGAVVVALGAPPVSVLAFEVALNATSMFNHANIRIPVGVDRWLRWLVVTPDMHRVHHSIEPRETNSNFGFNLPWWDHLLRTYRAQPAAGHTEMTIGVAEFRDQRVERLDWMLALPLSRRFRRSAQSYPAKSPLANSSDASRHDGDSS